MKFRLLSILFTLAPVLFYGQENVTPIEARLETENFHRTVSKGEQLFFLRPVKHREITEKKLRLSCISSLSSIINWEKDLVLSQFANVVNYNIINERIQILTVSHNLDLKTSTLRGYTLDLNGKEDWTKIELTEQEIGDWNESSGKAEVFQSFQSALDSRQSENKVTPLEYRFGYEISPDKKTQCVYRFDNSEENLKVVVMIYDESLNLKHTTSYYIDDAHIAYGLKIDNNGEIYQLKVSNSGTLAVLKVNILGETQSYLQIPKSSTMKTNPQLHIHANHQAYVSYSNVKNDRLVGISIALMDFNTKKVEDTHQYNFSEEFLNRQESVIKNGNHYFEMSEIVEYQGKLLLVLEQHLIDGVGVHYEPNSTERIGQWHQQPAQVSTGNIILVSFDKDLNPINALEIQKHQEGSNTDGMNTLGHFWQELDGEIYIAYTKGSSPYVLDELIVEKLSTDAKSWQGYKTVLLPKNYYAVVISLQILSKNKIFVHTRKGLLGKANFIGIYDF